MSEAGSNCRRRPTGRPEARHGHLARRRHLGAPVGPAVGQNTGAFRLRPCQAALARIFQFAEIRKWRMCRPSRLTKRGDLVSSLSRAGLAVDAAASGARGARAGRIALREPKTSCRMSGAVRFVSSVSFRLRRQGWKNCGEMAGRAYGKTVWSFPQALFGR